MASVIWSIERMDEPADDWHPILLPIDYINMVLVVLKGFYTVSLYELHLRLPACLQSLCSRFCRIIPTCCIPVWLTNLQWHLDFLAPIFFPCLWQQSCYWRTIVSSLFVMSGRYTCCAGQLRDSGDEKALPHIFISNESFLCNRANTSIELFAPCDAYQVLPGCFKMCQLSATKKKLATSLKINYLFKQTHDICHCGICILTCQEFK
jgi:hypothetical protein